MMKPNHVLVTGGAGFIGVHFIRYLFEQPDFGGTVVNLDKLTYAGSLHGLREIAAEHGGRRYHFAHGDICDEALVREIMQGRDIDTIVHFAAESHVDRSIAGPRAFIHTNIEGTFCLLEAAREVWRQREDVRFHHISTDEVYGSLGETGAFVENTAYDPRSPYSASKAASDHLVRAYAHTYGVPITVSHCSNNYGPYQFPEKLIPLALSNALRGEPIPIYGRGQNVRDWIHVGDHVRAVWAIIKQGTPGQSYNIGAENEWKNIDLIRLLCTMLAARMQKPAEHYQSLIRFVSDRAGHDQRYSLNTGKIRTELDWTPAIEFERGLQSTLDWYLDNTAWVKQMLAGTS